MTKKKNKNYIWIEKQCYIECGCRDYDHISRLWYIKDELEEIFEFEYRLCKFPWTGRKKTDTSHKPYNTSWDKIKFQLEEWGLYFKTIWWAIKGKPVWFNGITIYNKRSAKKIANFILRCLNENKENKKGK